MPVYKHTKLTHILQHPSSSSTLYLSSSNLFWYHIFKVKFKGRKMSRPGDWNCRSCHHLNFQRRDSCQRCGDPKSGDFGGFGGGRSGTSLGFPGSDVRPGDWYCTAGNCGTHNFASRSSCFKCGAFKDDVAGGFDVDMPRSRGGFGFGSGGGGGGGGRAGWKSGDWICTRPGCNEHNFASRTECFRCSAPREYPNNRSY